jgi:hypothetical protein
LPCSALSSSSFRVACVCAFRLTCMCAFRLACMCVLSLVGSSLHSAVCGGVVRRPGLAGGAAHRGPWGDLPAASAHHHGTGGVGRNPTTHPAHDRVVLRTGCSPAGAHAHKGLSCTVFCCALRAARPHCLFVGARVQAGGGVGTRRSCVSSLTGVPVARLLSCTHMIRTQTVHFALQTPRPRIAFCRTLVWRSGWPAVWCS